MYNPREMSLPEAQPLADFHVHAQEICVHDKNVADMFSITPGESRWVCPPVKQYVAHVTRNNLDTIWMIYEDVERFTLIRDAIQKERPTCIVNGFYFVRDPLNPNLEYLLDLHGIGLIRGIKLHPINDNYPLLPEFVDPTIAIAQQLNLPIIYHSDDRSLTMHLTSPENQEQLVTTYSDITFVIGHGGAYANPRLVGTSPQARSYWKTRGPLIQSALKLSFENPNVYYETSVMTNCVKAEIVADFINSHPLMALKILVGTDFPIKSSQVTSQIDALLAGGLSRQLANTIASNRL